MKTTIKIFFLLLFSLFYNGISSAQTRDFGSEKVHLFTDRTMYISGEEIHFFAAIENEHNQSDVLYLELIIPDGTALVSKKFPIINKHGEGKIELPSDLISGIYYLKTYTKYLRNFGANNFSYREIKIVNPFVFDFLQGVDNENTKDSVVVIQATINSKSLQDDHFEISLPANVLQSFENYGVSIVPEFSFTLSSIENQNSFVNKLLFYPETQGLSLSGLLVDSISGNFLAYKQVNLSIIDQKNFLVALSDKEGHFYFALPDITGNHDVFISIKKEEDVHPKILVDKDFDTEKIKLPNPAFVLSEKERKTVLELTHNLQIRNSFYTKTIQQQIDTFKTPFYGVAPNTLYLGKYIEMASLEEYFTELPGLVHIKNTKKGKAFAIYNPSVDMSIYNPLVLIDWVVVEDLDRILAVSPLGLEKVEIIPEPYVYGNFIYGGIISFRSLNNDFGGISLPKTGLFFNYEFFQPTTNINAKKDLNRIPKIENTVFWETGLNSASKSRKITYKKNHQDSKYWLIVQGINKRGETETKVFEIN